MSDENKPVDANSEDAMLAEWENMAEENEVAEAIDSGDAPPERILGQDEIDSLLGSDSSTEDSKSGNYILLDNSVVNYEKLPMLDHIFDKFERFLSTALRHFTADNVDVTIVSATSVRFGDYLDSIPLPAGLVVVNATGLDDYILTVYESQLIYAVVDILLGGRKARAARIEGRNFTNIERRIMDNLTEIVLQELTNAFAPIAPVKFVSERMEVNPRFAVVTREGNAALLVTVRVNLEGREGNIQFCLPYATLEPIREQLLQQFMGEKFGQDNIWENHLAQELYHTHTDISAVLDEVVMPLNEVLKLRVGDTLPLNVRENSEISLRCGKVTKMVGTMGRLADHKAVQVMKAISDVNNEKES